VDFGSWQFAFAYCKAVFDEKPIANVGRANILASDFLMFPKLKML
jgi:hypothetical protein